MFIFNSRTDFVSQNWAIRLVVNFVFGWCALFISIKSHVTIDCIFNIWSDLIDRHYGYKTMCPPIQTEIEFNYFLNWAAYQLHE